MNLIEPKAVEIDGKQFILSKFPAIVGREIISGYPLSAIPKIGDYKRNEEVMLKLFSHVAVVLENNVELKLASEALINNHVGGWENLVKLEGLMLEYNCSFLADGRVSGFFETLAQRLEALISKVSMDFLAQFSAKNKQL